MSSESIGHQVAAVTIEINKESKLLPIFIPMPKKDAVCAVAALKEALIMCNNCNLHQIPGSRIVRIQGDGGGSLPIKKFEIYVGIRTSHCLTLQHISHPLMVLPSDSLDFSKAKPVKCSNKHI